MADYFGHWLDLEKKADSKKLPKVFYVNWFRKNNEGKFIWPGFGENSRVLKWIYERAAGKGEAIETPIGYLPKNLDVSGLEVSQADMKDLFSVDKKAWLQEASQMRTYLQQYGDRVPKGITNELDALESRLSK